MGVNKLLYTEVCAWMRTNMRLSGTETNKLRYAEKHVVDVIAFGERITWIWARAYLKAMNRNTA